MWNFVFRCSACSYVFSLVELGDCWIDSCGHFGHIAHPSGQQIGTPDGYFVTTFYYHGICLACNEIYTTVRVPEEIDLIFEQFTEIDGRILVIRLEELISVAGPVERVFYDRMSNACTSCGGPLTMGFELACQVSNREKIWKFALPPLPEGESGAQCPKCQQNSLEYSQFFLA